MAVSVKRSFRSSQEMLDWQYKMLLGEVQQIELHETGDCPCMLNNLEPQERCLGKHLLNISTLAAETANMDSSNEKWLLQLADEANERHEQFRGFVCHKEDLPELSIWARSWRKQQIEPIYYSCKVKMAEPLKEDDLALFAQQLINPCLEAKSTLAKYADDVKAGHNEAAEFWKGQSEAFAVLCLQKLVEGVRDG